MGDSHVTTILFGEDSPLPPRLLLIIDFFTGDKAGEMGLPITSKVNFGDSLSLEMILTSAGLGGGDLSDCLSPKYGHVHGGGKGKDTLSVACDLLYALSSSKMSLVHSFSWKLEPRLRHLGDGASSLGSPRWKLAARLLFDDHGDASDDGTGDVVLHRLSEL